MLADGTNREPALKPPRWQFSLRASMVVIAILAVLLGLLQVAPPVGCIAAIALGGLLGYWVAKPFRSILVTLVCGAMGGALMGGIAASIVVFRTLLEEKETYVAALGLARYNEWAWFEITMGVGFGGLASGSMFGALVAAAPTGIKRIIDDRKAADAECSRIGLIQLRVLLYAHILATVYVAWQGYQDLYYHYPQGPLWQLLNLALLLVSFGFIWTPFVMIVIGIRRNVSALRWGPMVVADFVLLLIQLQWFLFLC